MFSIKRISTVLGTYVVDLPALTIFGIVGIDQRHCLFAAAAAAVVAVAAVAAAGSEVDQKDCCPVAAADLCFLRGQRAHHPAADSYCSAAQKPLHPAGYLS